MADKFFFMELGSLAQELVASVPEVRRIAMFGSRKYVGKVRSDLDLLISGPASADVLVDFRESRTEYQPLDLWLEVPGGTAVSAVNGGVLQIRDLDVIELFPNLDTARLRGLERQRFRSDVNYMMSLAPSPKSVAKLRADHLGMTTRLPTVLEDDLAIVALTVLEVLEHAVEAARRMRTDKNAMRGKSSHIAVATEYDLQNLAELVLSSIFSVEREPFVVRESGAERSADFSLASGRLVLEFKFAKTGSELSKQIKDAHSVLETYLKHPGVEVALGILGVVEDVDTNVNGIESWSTVDGRRKAMMRTLTIPRSITTA